MVFEYYIIKDNWKVSANIFKSEKFITKKYDCELGVFLSTFIPT